MSHRNTDSTPFGRSITTAEFNKIKCILDILLEFCSSYVRTGSVGLSHAGKTTVDNRNTDSTDIFCKLEIFIESKAVGHERRILVIGGTFVRPDVLILFSCGNITVSIVKE